jgi:uncharacterized membrane protein
MSFSYIHGENLISFIVVLYALAVIAWTAIVWMLIKLWQSRKKKK